MKKIILPQLGPKICYFSNSVIFVAAILEIWQFRPHGTPNLMETMLILKIGGQGIPKMYVKKISHGGAWGPPVPTQLMWQNCVLTMSYL